jgi:hypothetical protein
MAAGPRETPSGRDTRGTPDASGGESTSPSGADTAQDRDGARPRSGVNGSPASGEPFDPADDPDSLDELEGLADLDRPGAAVPGPLEPLGAFGSADPLTGEGSPLPAIEDAESFRELRPPRRLRLWQIAPIVVLAVGGSLMFAFPLAFESGDAGPVVAMLGLLLCCCAAGWGLTAARRVGQTWPGLPPRGSGERPDWRYVAGYTAVTVVLAVLAVWRVARLR